MPLIYQPSSRIRFFCPEEDKQEFASSHCIVAVSVLGQPKTDKEKFASILHKVNKTFNKCTILLADTLHRHTFKILNEDYTEEQLYRAARDAGDEWLERNQATIDALTIPHNTLRWQEWLNHPNFPAMKSLIDEFYEKNSHFRISVFKSVEEFLLRLDKSESSLNCTNAFRCSAEYLKEESAVMQLVAYDNYHFILYPGKRPLSIQLTYEHFIRPFYPNRLRWVELGFRQSSKPNKNPRSPIEVADAI
ncbi:MAG: Uncharacterized protein K0R66_11 [Gammaproteobacteria bacterium]|nr:Uncharacterized protein [Gammaproteobacteria bacterium]